MKYCIIFLISSTVLLWGSFSAEPQKIKAYVFLAEECPISIYMAKTLRDNADLFKDKVEFIAVFPNSRSNYKTMGVFIEKHDLGSYKRILDEDQSITKKLGGKVTPELILIGSDDQKIFQGQISNAFHKVGRRKSGNIRNVMKETLESALNGDPISQPWPRAVGCFITFRK